MFIESHFIDTSRRMDAAGKDDYLNSLGFKNEDDFLRWIGKDMVLDLGSGYGTLAKNVAMRKEKPQVVSLNPSLEKAEFIAESRVKTKELVNDGNIETIDSLNKAHEGHAVAARWDKLPFSDGSFSRILSSYAFPMYCKSGEEMQAVVRELKRVLKPGGEIRINAPEAHSIVNKKGIIIARNEFYNVFKKSLENEGLIVKEMAEYNIETDGLVQSLGGTRLQTSDQPFFISIIKPEIERREIDRPGHVDNDKPLIYLPGRYKN